MAAISIPSALQELCGLPPQMEPGELQELLPAIVHSIGVTHANQKREIRKAANLVFETLSFIPNDGFDRPERVSGFDGSPPPDPSACLDSVLPIGEPVP